MKVCPHCMQPMPESSLYCIDCGKLLREAGAVHPTEMVLVSGAGRNAFFWDDQYNDSIENDDGDDEAFFQEYSPDQRVTTWQKVVETSDRPRTAARRRRPPLPAQSLPGIRLLPFMKFPIPPVVFFWVSFGLMVTVVAAGLVGVVEAMGHSTQVSPSSRSPVLTVSPQIIATGLITVHGTGFFKNSSIELRRDDENAPLIDVNGRQLISTSSQGSFSDQIEVDERWQDGQHYIIAEDLSHREVSFPIYVFGNNGILRPPHIGLTQTTINVGSGDQATNSVQQLKLMNSGFGQIHWSSSTTQPWLMVSPSSGTYSTNTSVSVAVNRYNLQPGSYVANVIFTSNAGESILAVHMQVTRLSFQNASVLQLTPSLLSFNALDNGPEPSSQVVTISNPGTLPLSWKASSSSSWLLVTPASGTVKAHSSVSVIVSVITRSLLPGSYNGMISFIGQGDQTVHRLQQVYTNVGIWPSCALQVTPGMLTFSAALNQTKGLQQNFSLKSSSGCSTAMNWTATSGSTWLKLATTRGKVGATATSLTASVDSSGMTAGNYITNITLSSDGSNLIVPVSFSLTQTTAPVMNVSSSQIAFSSAANQAAPAAQTVVISNHGSGTLLWKASLPGDWVTVTPSQGSLKSQQSITVRVSVLSSAGLMSSSYSGLLDISGTDGNSHSIPGGHQSVPVSWQINPACALSLATTALTFAGVAGQGAVNGQTVALVASGSCSGPVDWNASVKTDDGGSWLSLQSSSGSSSLAKAGLVSLGVNLSRMISGDYHGTVSITGVDTGTHLPILVSAPLQVALDVQPACTLQSPSTGNLALTPEQGSGKVQATFTLSVVGTCQGQVTINAVGTPSDGGSWLSVAPTKASVASGATETVTVSVDTTSLQAGVQYAGTISLAAVDNGLTIVGSPQTVAVSVTIQQPATLAASPSSLSFTGSATGSQQLSVTVNNSGGAMLGWSSALQAGAPAFVSLPGTVSGTLGAGASASLTVQVDTTGVASGTYTTGLVIGGKDLLSGQSMSVTVPITITVGGVQVSSASLSFSASGGTTPAAQQVLLTDHGGSSVSWSVGYPSQSWLSVAPVSGTTVAGTSTPLSFQVDATGVASNSIATVLITPSTGLPITVSVTLVAPLTTVTPAPLVTGAVALFALFESQSQGYPLFFSIWPEELLSESMENRKSD